MPNSEAEERVKQDLDQLSPESLQRVKWKIDRKLQKTKTQKGKETDSEESLFYSVLKDTLEYYCYGKVMPYQTFKRGKFYKSYKEKFPVVQEFMQQHFPDAKLVERKMIYRTFSRLIIKRINQWEDVEVRIGTCAVNVDRIPSLVDRAFPGYAKNGLLSMLIKRSYQDGRE